MKRNILLIFLIVLGLFSCKSDDNTPEPPCILYTAFISNDCDCMDEQCGTLYFISESEYNRLNDLLTNSSDPCLSVTGIDTLGITFIGILIETDQGPCPDPFSTTS